MRTPTVGEWLQEWLAAKKGIRAGTVRSYEGHIRLYLAPCVGHIPLDRLRVADVASVFDYIGGLNEAVTAARARADPERRKAVKGSPSSGPGVLPADPSHLALGDRRLHEAASRGAARQRRRSRRAAGRSSA